MTDNKIGVLLAGGMSRRFGAAKAFAPINGKPMFAYSLEALQAVAAQSLIVSHPELTARFKRRLSLPILEDMAPFQGCGPLAGLRTAMKTGQAEWYLTVPCDTPNVQGEIYERLLAAKDSQAKAIIPLVQQKRQPLIGLYHSSCLAEIESLLEKQVYKVGALFSEAPTRFVEDSLFEKNPQWFVNVNDYSEYLRWKENKHSPYQ